MSRWGSHNKYSKFGNYKHGHIVACPALQYTVCIFTIFCLLILVIGQVRKFTLKHGQSREFYSRAISLRLVTAQLANFVTAPSVHFTIAHCRAICQHPDLNITIIIFFSNTILLFYLILDMCRCTVIWKTICCQHVICCINWFLSFKQHCCQTKARQEHIYISTVVPVRKVLHIFMSDFLLAWHLHTRIQYTILYIYNYIYVHSEPLMMVLCWGQGSATSATTIEKVH